MILYIKNYKGGVGKSTITKNLASALELLDNKVAIVTFDSQNDSLAMLGNDWNETKGFKYFVKTGEDYSVKVRKNLNYYPLETGIFGNNLKSKLKKSFELLRERYDVIFIDGAPAVDGLLDKVALEISDTIVVPIKLDKFSVKGLGRFLETEFAEKISIIIPNLYEGTTIDKTYYKDLKELLSESSIVLANPLKKISFESKLAEKGKTIFESDSKIIEGEKEKYAEIIEEIFNEDK